MKDLFSENSNTPENVLDSYSLYGINSFLGPNVDYEKIDSNYKLNIDKMINLCNKNKQIVCLKHFCYVSKNGNTHLTKSINYKNIQLLEDQDLMPYKYFQNKYKKKFLIMVGHHIIENLDSLNIASKSKIVNYYIKNKFPNSLTISDEITMRASMKNRDFNNLKETQTDIILTHGGNFKNYREVIYNKLNAIDRNINENRIKKILDLKKENKLLFIELIKY